MKATQKKGFTIVELVIVIAVIAILAAVLIPTFVNLINKANLSKDQQAVANMNKDLAMEDALDGFEYAGDAINALATYGFYGDKFDAFATGYHYAYDLEQNMMYLLDEAGEPVYPNDKAEKENLWGLYNNDKYDIITGITQYVALATINIESQFNAVDGVPSGTTIDLAGKVITVDPGDKTITLINGYVEASVSSKYTVDDANTTQLETKELVYNNSTSATNAYFASSTAVTLNFTAGDVTYEGCVFDMKSAFSVVGSSNVTFKNCTFISDNAGQWALTIGGTNEDCYKGTITVEDCSFQSGRGININPRTVNVSSTIIIKNCEFTTSNANKGAIQIAGIGNESISSTVIIEGNNFVSCPAAVTVSSSAPKATSVYENVTFTNNTLAEGVNKVIADGNDTTRDAVVTALNEKFK